MSSAFIKMSFIVTTETPLKCAYQQIHNIPRISHNYNQDDISFERVIQFEKLKTSTVKDTIRSGIRRACERKHETKNVHRATAKVKKKKNKLRLKEREVVISANCNDNISFCVYTIFNTSMSCTNQEMLSVAQSLAVRGFIIQSLVSI